MARSLDIMGDRWTILVLRDLFRGLSKFGDILESLEGISPNLLADRLKRLEQRGIVERVFYSDHPPRAEYCLTEKGNELGPVIQALAEWGIRYELEEERKAFALATVTDAYGHENREDARFCDQCAAELAPVSAYTLDGAQLP